MTAKQVASAMVQIERLRKELAFQKALSEELKRRGKARVARKRARLGWRGRGK